LVTKEWIFKEGGRPVIYQTDEEFNELPETHRWRHVRYDPLSDPPIDFTWEREWRINCEELHFDSDVASIVVPDDHWAVAVGDPTPLVRYRLVRENLERFFW